MSNIQLQLKTVISAVGKLTHSFKSVQRDSKKLMDSVWKIQGEFKLLNQSVNGIKPVLKYAQETARISTRTDLKLFNQLINKSLSVQSNTKETVQIRNDFKLVNKSVSEFNFIQNNTQGIVQTSKSKGNKENRGLIWLIINELKLLNQSVNDLKPIVKYAQETTRIRGDIKSLNKSIDKLQPVSNRIQGAVSTNNRNKGSRSNGHLGRIREFSERITNTGEKAKSTGLNMLETGKNIVMPGYELEPLMSRLQVLTNVGKDSPEYVMQRKQIREESKSSGLSVNQVAQGHLAYASASYTPEQIKNMMPGTIAMSRVSGMDLAATAEIGVNALASFKLQSKDMSHANDVMAATLIGSRTTLAALGDAIQYVGPKATSLGTDFETVAAAIGKLSYANINGVAAGGALEDILGRLANPPKIAAEALEQLSIKTRDAEGNLRKLPDILAELDNKTRSLNQAQRDNYLNAIGGDDAAPALDVLASQAGTGGLQTEIGKLKGPQVDGTAQKAASEITNNLDGDIQKLNAAWRDLGVQISSGVDGSLRGVTQKITIVVDKIGAWMEANPRLVSTLATVTMAIGGGLVVFGTLLQGISPLLSMVGMAISGFTRLRSAGAGLGTIFGSLGSVTSKVIGPIGNALQILGNVGVRALSLLGNALQILGNVGVRALSLLGNALQILGNVGVRAPSLLGNALQILGNVGVQALSLLGNALSILGRTMMLVGRLMMANPILAIIGLIAMAAVYIWQNWESLGPKFTQLWEGIKKSVSDKWDEIVNDVKSLPEKFKKFGAEIINSLLEGIKEKYKSVIDKFSSITDWVKSWLKGDSKAEVAVKASQEVTNSSTSSDAATVIAATAHDKGGIIPAGRFGIVGEYGPEIIRGPANVTSRKKTAAYAALGLSVGAMMPFMAAAQTAPMHFQSLPVHAYPEVQERAERSQPQQHHEAPQYHIYVYGSPGQSAQDIARMVRHELEQRERMQQARLRSSFSDREDF
ncbi:phage tail tape measure protein [Photorhabdus sp. APURE]|uniref:phage tail tape measure protein n=1 Tax=Photorhabdus aballayi TaxID=2991723 RepID=UPI00223E15BB|nr:phage tail tape measure protein [Photorhabdus aballayi]MCW7550857.1 phage tail tape measure protein [Photorhabdus aballayi]